MVYFVGIIPLCLILIFVDFAHAACPNMCSGKGTCDGQTCICYPGYNFLSDCSLMECPKGPAWFDKATGETSAHGDVECSNVGVCDRLRGICNCNKGWEGANCGRKSCPNRCSGNGVCKNIAEVAEYYGAKTAAGTTISYTN